MDAAAPAFAGTVIANTYRLERVLGEGGMGLVYEAAHLRVPRKVAIKILRAIPDAEMLGRFKLEAEVASRIGHPNIVSILDFDTLPSGIPFIVMELLEGESLAALLQRGPLPIPRALSILRQVAAALQAAHAAGVVHRDLKPANVFLLAREIDGVLVDDVKVLDFGVSKVQGSPILTLPDVVLGTPRYMAPEQAEAGVISPRTDQFALAVMAYEMLSGKLPFGEGTASAIMYKVVYEGAPPLASVAPHLPPDLIAAIERAMSKRPDDRFADMAEMVVALTGRPLVDRASGRALRPSLPPAVSASIAPTQAWSRAPEPPTAGERPSNVKAPAAAAHPSPRRRTLLYAIIGIAVVAAAIVLVLRPWRSRAVAPFDAQVVAELPDAATRAVDAQRSDDVVDAVLADAVAHVDAAARVGSNAARTELTADQIDELLDRADAAITARRPADAEAAANRVLAQTAANARARGMLVIASCGRGDAKTARTRLDQMARGHWKADARSRCRDLGARLGKDPE